MLSFLYSSFVTSFNINDRGTETGTDLVKTVDYKNAYCPTTVALDDYQYITEVSTI